MEPGCVFCDRSKLEGRLITEDEDFYLVATLGQITDGGYTLIVPKKHFSCIGAMPLELQAKLQFFQTAAMQVMLAEYGVVPTACEHGIIGQTIPHAHLHLIPATLDFTRRVMNDFPGSETYAAGSMEHLIREFARAGEPYLYWHTPGEPNGWVCWDPKAPKMYFRILAAEMLGRPERADWRAMDPALDKKFGDETVARLKPRFNTHGGKIKRRS